MTDKELEELLGEAENHLAELFYILAGKDWARSAELHDDMAHRLKGQAAKDRERAQKKRGRVAS